MNNDTQSRKWQLTINKPKEKNLEHEVIKKKLSELKSLIYYCMADEIGEQGTYHTHIYVCLKNPAKFSRLKKLFSVAHLEKSLGTSEENKNYILKQGKWEHDKKSETSVEGTYEEWGELPEEKQGARTDIVVLVGLIKDGYTDYQIIEEYPEFALRLDHIGKIRQRFQEEENITVFRKLYVTYIYGKTGTGKTRSVMEHYGYRNVYRVTDYEHPFDGYLGQDIIIFEEFRSSLKIADMLKYLDGYPTTLPCRYYNKQACYTKVFIISNIVMEKQYTTIQIEEAETWNALLRRINQIVQYNEETYKHRKEIFCKIDKEDEQIELKNLIDVTYDNNSESFEGECSDVREIS